MFSRESVRMPGGRLTAAQYLALHDLSGRWGGDSLRVTTRQAVQFHAVAKGNLKPTVAAINDALLTTLGAVLHALIARLKACLPASVAAVANAGNDAADVDWDAARQALTP